MHICYGKFIAQNKDIIRTLVYLEDAIEHISRDGILEEPFLTPIFRHFPHLENLKNTYEKHGESGFNKYRHTLKLVRNFYILKTLPDIDSLSETEKQNIYANFYNVNKLPNNAFSLKNFEELCRRYKKIITTAEEEYIFLYWLIAHDYGTTTEHTELNVTHHTTWSSRIARNEIIKQHNRLFKQLNLDLTELMLDSHSCFGDLFLCEASFHNYEILQQKFNQINLKNSTSNIQLNWEKVLGYLVLLNIIDVNSGNAGSNLYSNHFQKYMEILDNTYFQKTPEEECIERIRFFFETNEGYLDVSQSGLTHEEFILNFAAEINTTPAFKNNFRELYLQYFYGIFQRAEENYLLNADLENPGHILAERLIKQLCILWDQARFQDINIACFDYIVFENGKSAQEVNKLLAERCQKYSLENCVDLKNKTFLGIKYNLPDPLTYRYDDRFLSIETEKELEQN